MSPPSTLDLDFGFGNLLDGHGGLSVNAGASGFPDFGGGTLAGGGGNTASDLMNLSNLFEAQSNTGPAATAPMGANGNVSAGNVVPCGGANTAGTSAATVGPTTLVGKKTSLLDQQQQLQQEQNSLNALLNHHTSSSGASSSALPTPFGFSTREELETLSASASASAAPAVANTAASAVPGAGMAGPVQQTQQQASSFASQQLLSPAATAIGAPAGRGASCVTSSACGSGQNSAANYMFVATIVDPAQEDAPPQQMLFLPGSNQVIPMMAVASPNAAVAPGPGAPALAPMMALANLPIVFPQTGSAAGAGGVAVNSANLIQVGGKDGLPNSVTTSSPAGPAPLQLPVLDFTASSIQAPQEGMLSLNGLPAGLSSLEEAFSASTQPQAPAPAPIDFSSLGLAPVSEVSRTQHQQLQQLPPLIQRKVETPATASNAVSANACGGASNSKVAMPIRPLSAYNFFFSDERERILQNKSDEADIFDNAKKQRLLLQHLAKDRSKRRPHRKTHGKINFTTLSKLIGQRWKQLPDDRKNFYREVAAIDLERYQRELRERSPGSNHTSTVEMLCT